MVNFRARLAPVGEAASAFGRLALSSLERAVWATVIVAVIYYVFEPLLPGIGWGSTEGWVLFLPLLWDFMAYTGVQFAERFVEPFVVALVLLAPPVRFLIERYTTGSPVNELLSNVAKAVVETGITLALYWHFFGSAVFHSPEYQYLLWSFAVQIGRYTVTQFLARIAEPYVVKVLAPHAKRVRFAIGKLFLGIRFALSNVFGLLARVLRPATAPEKSEETKALMPAKPVEPESIRDKEANAALPASESLAPSESLPPSEPSEASPVLEASAVPDTEEKKAA